MGPLELWFFGGFIPQLTVWIAYTVLVSTLLGAAVVAIMKPKALQGRMPGGLDRA